ncbi:hypothetical protein HKD24_06680 [Gluconobacter sp. LMG 31484]|uniref:Uncharacterized protein n=1 Tax=Gluconobacter vitians TaxID=2728102 RepID=A0ABR9Y611_9PROT|nr:hypothetical protein [Gluconobacter vitians]MBF0858899.1 hypothetical protein [Gluconobacter vitians]
MQHIVMCREKAAGLVRGFCELFPGISGPDPQIGIKPPATIVQDHIQAEQIGPFGRMTDLEKEFADFSSIMIVKPPAGRVPVKEYEIISKKIAMVLDIVFDFFRRVFVPVHVKAAGNGCRGRDGVSGCEASRSVAQGEFQIKSVYFFPGMKNFKGIPDKIQAFARPAVLPGRLNATDVIGQLRRIALQFFQFFRWRRIGGLQKTQQSDLQQRLWQRVFRLRLAMHIECHPVEKGGFENLTVNVKDIGYGKRVLDCRGAVFFIIGNGLMVMATLKQIDIFV